ncbi:daunorubicin resistance protein DrrA family ABC transporter ATP-binding protein [Fervidicoccus fontis]|jgi:ABC-2 type transport system ATP-binding protein|uniref:ABC transporter, ATP binding protein n=2 Tax=Fervidicoccus fontis TaxID=683846 RepID=I0A133_FERFK|nr:daunorubicin resistance protein DrrA family ABC transporter ATP-binding protein [Fervidicoccus fontis]AFH42690.1 ABC transporter, ATP binding protein [Fervidicoccus fontis Kam940]MBE9391268.1 daunorubicin resistance protein DrrA family ABC transporter ATP-binding protein [Fervidicoccus fontis]
MDDIVVENLWKIYPGNIAAVKGISFKVEHGEVFSLLGPNGAGKTTTISILTTLINPTKGVAKVGGYDVVTQANKVRSIIGLVPQDVVTDDDLSGWDNLMIQASLYHLPRSVAVKRAEELLEFMELKEFANKKTETYSGGMRRRLELAAALLHRPKILFLDEPTLGLDVQVRTAVWNYINRLRKEEDMTIFLTTHYMDEADKLSDRVAIIDYGEIKIIGTPKELKDSLGGDIIEIQLISDQIKREEVQKILSSNGNGSVKEVSIGDSGLLRIKTANGEEVLPEIITKLYEKGYKIKSVDLKKPSLDEVFLQYTGKRIRDSEVSSEETRRERAIMRRRR